MNNSRDVLQNGKKAYFSHLFRHFWPNKIFSQKSGPVTF